MLLNSNWDRPNALGFQKQFELRKQICASYPAVLSCPTTS
jgi:hypothetical protein